MAETATFDVWGEPIYANSMAPNGPAQISEAAKLAMARGVRHFATQALLRAATGMQADYYAFVANIPGAMFRYDGANWVMLDEAQFPSAAARDAAITTPAAGMRARLLDRGYVTLYTGSGWVGAGGLVRVKPTGSLNGTINADGSIDFSAAANLRLDGIFSSDFDHYKVILKFATSVLAGALSAQLAVGSVAETSANYVYAGAASNGTLAPAGWGSTGTGNGFDLARAHNDANRKNHVELDLFDPAKANLTTAKWSSMGDNGSGILTINSAGTYNIAKAVDGLMLWLVSGGTFTGRAHVYGYGAA